jgi:hypothetical protein
MTIDGFNISLCPTRLQFVVSALGAGHSLTLTVPIDNVCLSAGGDARAPRALSFAFEWFIV